MQTMSAEGASAAVAAPAESSSSKKIQELVAMGYPEEKCTKALHVAGGDMEQAVGFLLMGDKSQRGFEYSSEEAIASGDYREDEIDNRMGRTEGSSMISPAMWPREGNTMTPPQPPELTQTPGVYSTGSEDLEDQLMSMGYSRNQTRQALRVAQGDLEQAANFLLMGDSRAGFVLESEGSHRSFSTTDNDAAVAAAMQEEALLEHARNNDHQPQYHQPLFLPPTNRGEPGPVAPAVVPDSATGGPKPKIVATQTFLTTPGAGPFCTCVAASRFLMGGVVSAPFFNSIMEAAIELYRKSAAVTANADDDAIESIIRKYGRSHLGIQVVTNGDDDPKHGVFMPHDVQHDRGIRKLLAACRNEQKAGWQIILVAMKYDSFCICLPPKGTSNKFWFLDFLPRSNVQTPGAYALVHYSLLQMEESIESVFRTILTKQESEFGSFTLYRIKELGQ
jgi:UBA/TS-N domain